MTRATPAARSLTVPAMRLSVLLLLALAADVAAQPAPALATATAPDWTDAPAVLAAAMAPIDADLRACLEPGRSRTLGIIVRRERSRTIVMMPLPLYVGILGLTPEDDCLLGVVPRAVVPPLPPLLEHLVFAYPIAPATPPAVDPQRAAWRDPAATLAGVVDPSRDALAACDARPRPVRVVIDRRRNRTRAWLPAWQFHRPGGDGTTPPRERRVKACLARVVRRWALPLLPRDLGDLHIVVPTTPR